MKIEIFNNKHENVNDATSSKAKVLIDLKNQKTNSTNIELNILNPANIRDTSNKISFCPSDNSILAYVKFTIS
jgi:hypothetical protein